MRDRATTILEARLRADLARLGERLADEKLCADLYRALTNTTLTPADGDGHLSLSWSTAERIVNDLRAQHGRAPLTLAQTGGEGRVSDTVREELERLGWRIGPLDTGRHDPAHDAADAESPPPRFTGAAQAPSEAATREERFRRAHEAADANRLRRA